MKNKFLILTLVCLVLAVVVIVGINTTGLFSAPQHETIKIGLIAPLTGDLASWGQSGLAGAKLAIDETNANGGINGKQIEFVVEDSKSNKEDAVKAMNKLLFVDEVDAIVFADGSNAASASIPLVNQKHTPLILTVASNPDLTSISDYIFRVYPSDTLQGKFAADYIYNNLGKKKVALLTGQNVWGKGVSDVFKQNYKGQIVFDETVPNEQTEFKTTIDKMQKSGADIIYLVLYPQTILPAESQLKEAGNKLPIIGGDMYDTGDVISSGVAEGTIYTLPKVNLPKDFEARIKSLPGFGDLKVSIASSVAYDAIKIFVNGFKNAGTKDPSAVQRALKETNHSGISSPMIQFDSVGDLKTGQIEVRKIVNKESVVYNN